VKAFLLAAVRREIIATSVKVALVVGSVLASINYGDRILFGRNMQRLDWIKLVVTYCVPYGVATYGAAMYAMRHARHTGADRTPEVER
jgi:hypothetical protein